MKVWITKYALTSGVITCDAEICEECSDMILVSDAIKRRIYYYKPDWHDNENDAIDRITLMIQRKIKSNQTSTDNLYRMINRMRDEGISACIKRSPFKDKSYNQQEIRNGPRTI